MGVLAARTESGCCYYPVHWWQHKVLWLMQELISSLWVELCLGISAIYPSLQCQSSSGSVGKSIWPEFRRLRFKSWLDLNFFLRQVILNVICILELWQGFAAVLTCLLKIFTAEYHAILLELRSEAILATIFVWTKLSKWQLFWVNFAIFNNFYALPDFPSNGQKW